MGFILVIYMIRELMKIFRYGTLSYMSNLYNLWEMVIILLSIGVVIVYWKKNAAVWFTLNNVSTRYSSNLSSLMNKSLSPNIYCLSAG